MSMNTRLLLITFLCVFSIGQCIAQTWYTGKDNFRQAIFQDSILSDYNYHRYCGRQHNNKKSAGA